MKIQLTKAKQIELLLSLRVLPHCLGARSMRLLRVLPCQFESPEGIHLYDARAWTLFHLRDPARRGPWLCSNCPSRLG